jgi:CubicO group peptidase (beta-lactamase class C family)
MIKRKSQTVFFALLLVLSLSGLSADNEKFAKVDGFFTDLDSTHTPGAAVAIIQNDKIVYEKAFGMASLELEVPNTTGTVFRIGSISKQFTAACIAMLALEKKLSLDDPLTKYFPELPTQVYQPVTIRHMLHHTSGVRDSEAMYPFMGIDYSQWYTHPMFLDMLKRQKALNFKPGEKIEYSNSAYTLLALIVEKVSGKKFAEFANDRIFAPLGMEDTRIQTCQSTFIPNRAAGYKFSSGQFNNWMTDNQLLGHDAVYSNVEDMFKWEQAFFNGKLGKELVPMMTSPGKLNDGTVLSYGFGLSLEKYKGLTIIDHSGWYVGYTAYFIIFPEQQFAVVCLSNLGTYNPRRPCLSIAELFLADQFKAAQNAPAYKERIKESVFSSKLLKKLSGEYVGTELGGSYGIEIMENKLRVKSTDIVFEPSPYSKFELISPERFLSIRVSPESMGKDNIPVDLLVSVGSAGRYQQFKEILVPENEFAKYAGEYVSEELGNTCRIAIENKKLAIQFGDRSTALTQFEKDQFATDLGSIAIARDENGAITGFKLSFYGAHNLIFKRTPENR